MSLEIINKLLDEIKEDRTVPKNIRLSVEQAQSELNDNTQEMSIRVNGAISILDEVSNDTNIPVYSRTQVWNIVSMLEALQKK